MAGGIAAAAHRARALSTSGALAAWAVGTAVFAAGGWIYTAVLFSFFLPSTLLSRAGRARKLQLTDIGKLGARDAWQVLANGGVAAACALFAWTMHSAPAAAAFAGAFAAASADTWGTEIGTLASGRPRSILTFQSIDTGLSGGVTFAGTFAEIIGAILVALVASLLGVGAWWAIAAGGIAGALADSIIGASAQELRYCPHCERSCEIDPHWCGTPTSIARGSAWMNNDAVNISATLVGAALAGFLTYIKP